MAGALAASSHKRRMICAKTLAFPAKKSILVTWLANVLYEPLANTINKTVRKGSFLSQKVQRFITLQHARLGGRMVKVTW